MDLSLLDMAFCVVGACNCDWDRYLGKRWGVHPMQMGAQYRVAGVVLDFGTRPHCKHHISFIRA